MPESIHEIKDLGPVIAETYFSSPAGSVVAAPPAGADAGAAGTGGGTAASGCSAAK
jgi:hypothetical protein